MTATKRARDIQELILNEIRNIRVSGDQSKLELLTSLSNAIGRSRKDFVRFGWSQEKYDNKAKPELCIYHAHQNRWIVFRDPSLKVDVTKPFEENYYLGRKSLKFLVNKAQALNNLINNDVDWRYFRFNVRVQGIEAYSFLDEFFKEQPLCLCFWEETDWKGSLVQNSHLGLLSEEPRKWAKIITKPKVEYKLAKTLEEALDLTQVWRH